MKFFEERAHWGPAILRLFLGVAFVVAALDKILGLEMARGMFEGMFGSSLGAPLLYLAIFIELVGGLALIFNFHAACAALVLAGLILVAFVKTFKLGQAPHMVGVLREIMVMNTGGGNTAVNFAYFAGLLSLVFGGCTQCKVKSKGKK